ncbi:protein-L-isoaspartate O-methyltransferase [Tsuneonella suprasediminis]|uniref:protein-L-isoaspartate O-methyltransferase family protein n=1 Tax=Tsuneonella suprasediminis TaxID=2306996 RepID=UPI002F9548D0
MTVAISTATDFATARKAMIDSQLRTSGVNEPWVIARMAAVPREDFVPESARAAAYIDRAVSLGEGKMLAAPEVQGRMLAEAAPALDDKALVVDGGSGYLPALLEPLVGSITVITPDDAVAASRKRGDFTLLLIDGAVEELPDNLTNRLADEGRLVTGLVRRGVTRLAVGRKTAGAVALWPLAEIGIPRLAQFDKTESWSF